jgi:hypothetical protein
VIGFSEKLTDTSSNDVDSGRETARSQRPRPLDGDILIFSPPDQKQPTPSSPQAHLTIEISRRGPFTLSHSPIKDDLFHRLLDQLHSQKLVPSR